MAQLTLVLLLLEASVVCFLASASVLEDNQASTTRGQRPVDVTEALKRQPASYSSDRIVGGNPATYGQYPWQVRISPAHDPTSLGCGGVIIDEFWILTAAHCFMKPSSGFGYIRGHRKIITEALVHVGELNRRVLDEHEQQFKVKRVILHKKYDEDEFDFDIALLKLKKVKGKGIQFNDYVKPALLPDKDTPYTEGKMCLVSGWGVTNENDLTFPAMLHGAEVPLYNEEECRKIHGDRITPRMFCAGFKEGKADTCKGDSGGPLVCKEEGGHTVMGITIWGGPGCGQPNTPGVYTRITRFVTWIAKKMGK